MSGNAHHYNIITTWTGNRGTGTASYEAYSRDYTIHITGKPELYGSSDPAFRGDAQRYNPEELLLASLASCHMLWYLHLCAAAGIVVTEYEDRSSGRMKINKDGGGRFEEVVLHPVVTITDVSQKTKALELHRAANGLCFIASSVNFPVLHQPEIAVK
ncbi:OsmC family protein [Niabella beijingensis]|uniref:OsmC family protein n=1 Tax=Niabella beijingensis TaxID=2872700 RepID=UPI001CBD1810|nr:OsmC family protein [Niabella beijingensis]MBZ4190183.1 OsmC family protein [Niabella beijingensis]